MKLIGMLYPYPHKGSLHLVIHLSVDWLENSSHYLQIWVYLFSSLDWFSSIFS